MTARAVVAPRGTIFPDAALPAADGVLVQLESFRGQRNLVLVFTGDAPGPGPATPLLDGLVARKGELASEVAQVFVVAATPPAAARVGSQWAFFPVLVDHDARVHRSVGATDDAGRPAAALFITDRFREIYAADVSATGLP